MSSNISTWKTKQIKEFVLPLIEIQKMPDIEIIIGHNNTMKITGLCEEFVIDGVYDFVNGQLLITKIEISGEHSRSIWDDFKKMLSKSKGILIAIQIWEGGNTITELSVIDGNVSEKKIEL